MFWHICELVFGNRQRNRHSACLHLCSACSFRATIYLAHTICSKTFNCSRSHSASLSHLQAITRVTCLKCRAYRRAMATATGWMPPREAWSGALRPVAIPSTCRRITLPTMRPSVVPAVPAQAAPPPAAATQAASMIFMDMPANAIISGKFFHIVT